MKASDFKGKLISDYVGKQYEFFHKVTGERYSVTVNRNQGMKEAREQLMIMLEINHGTNS